MVIDTDPLRKRVEVEDEKCARVDVRGTSWDVESWRSAKNASLARATPARLPRLAHARACGGGGVMMAVRPAARAALTAASAHEATTATVVVHATRLWRRRRAGGREAGRESGLDGDVGARGDDGDAGGARNAPVAAAAC